MDIVKEIENIILNKHGFLYTEINLDNDDKRKAFYKKVNQEEKLSGDKKLNTVPQIYINDVRKGGNTELLNIY